MAIEKFDQRLFCYPSEVLWNSDFLFLHPWHSPSIHKHVGNEVRIIHGRRFGFDGCLLVDLAIGGAQESPISWQ